MEHIAVRHRQQPVLQRSHILGLRNVDAARATATTSAARRQRSALSHGARRCRRTQGRRARLQGRLVSVGVGGHRRRLRARPRQEPGGQVRAAHQCGHCSRRTTLLRRSSQRDRAARCVAARARRGRLLDVALHRRRPHLPSDDARRERARRRRLGVHERRRAACHSMGGARGARARRGAARRVDAPRRTGRLHRHGASAAGAGGCTW
mmetsp:Transcript_1514/g.3556  ORF Transcript_1514/g.3556 Transcript_1514/m.3556 type:complete len:208 (+) Transcript_1514:289-912(+)